ncbi:MAG: hypothetical protein ACXV8U_01005 [Methylobacter sp.]
MTYELALDECLHADNCNRRSLFCYTVMENRKLFYTRHYVAEQLKNGS